MENQKSGTVLLVEDHPVTRSLIRAMLRDYVILEAENGVEANELFDKNQDSIDLIITDIAMPQQDGLTTVKIIRHLSPEIPIIVISAFSSKELIDIASELNVDAYLIKPLQPLKLKNTVSQLVSSRKKQGGSKSGESRPVLLFDQNVQCRRLISDILQELGYEVDSVGDVDEIAQHLQQVDYHTFLINVSFQSEQVGERIRFAIFQSGNRAEYKVIGYFLDHNSAGELDQTSSVKEVIDEHLPFPFGLADLLSVLSPRKS